MSGNVSARGKSAKSGQFQIRNQKRQIRNQLSPVMQKTRDLLPPVKCAEHLHILTDVPLSTCQKMLAGVTPENLDLVTALLRGKHGREILFALMGDARPEWFSRYCKQLDAVKLHRQLQDSQRRLNALQAEVLG